jgi:predicted Zn finger-like uncharacterized protein
MALATQCPHCGKRFRVAADQLKLRGGIVRCGACHEIFDGNATLIDLDAPAPKQAASAPEIPTSVTSPELVVPAQEGTMGDHRPPHTERPETQPVSEPEVATPAQEPHAPEPEPAVEASAHPSAPALDNEPIYTLDFDHTFDQFGILPKVEEPAAADETEGPDPDLILQAQTQEHPEPALMAEESSTAAEAPRREPSFDTPAPSYADARRIEPTFDMRVDEELIAAALPEHDDFEPQEPTRSSPHAASAPLPMRESAPADPLSAHPRPTARSKAVEARAARRSKLTPTKIAPPKLRVPEIDEPEFVKRTRQQEQSGKTRRILMAVGSVVLLLALAAQGVTTFRNELAARYPALKPALLAACTALRCRVELPARIDNLTIEQGELTALGTSTYSLATLLHNQGNLVQAWPHIELTLTDTNDKPLLRRVFTPAEYLPQGTLPASGFAARAEQPVKLYFQLDQLKPSGYRIAVFYP